MNKILLNGLHYENNGAGISRYTSQLINTFIEGDYPVDILMRGEFGDRYNSNNIIRVDKMLPSSSKRIIEEQWVKNSLYKKYNLVHFPDYATPVFYQRHKVATIHDMAMHTMRDKYTRMQNLTKYTLLQATIRSASHLICDSEFTKKELFSYYPNVAADISVIHLGIDPPKVVVDDRKAKDILAHLGITHKYLLYVGTIAPHKNIVQLIKAFYEIKKIHREYKLVIAGKKGWMYDEVFNQVSALDLEEEVIFTGFVDELELETLYKEAEFYISLSLYEGFGLPPLEAMVRGCPVLVSDLEIFKETCGDSALFCSPNQLKEIISGMRSLIEHQELRNQLREKGLLRVKRFNWAETARRTYEVYQSVLK